MTINEYQQLQRQKGDEEDQIIKVTSFRCPLCTERVAKWWPFIARHTLRCHNDMKLDDYYEEYLTKKKLKDGLTCFVCEALFVSPTVLNCGHLFCERCLFTPLSGTMKKTEEKEDTEENTSQLTHCPKCKLVITARLSSSTVERAVCITNVFYMFVLYICCCCR